MIKLGRVLAVFSLLAKDRRGFFLLETVVAVTVFSVVGTAVLVGVTTAHRAGATVEQQSVAENLARNQMEYVFAQAYQAPPASYPLISAPAGYAITADAEVYQLGETSIQKVVVIVTRNSKDLLTLETLRTNR